MHRQHCGILSSTCPEDNSMPKCSAVTSIACNYAAKSITMLATVNAGSIDTVLNVTSLDLTQLYIITLEGVCCLCTDLFSQKATVPQV